MTRDERPEDKIRQGARARAGVQRGGRVWALLDHRLQAIEARLDQITALLLRQQERPDNDGTTH